MTHHSNINHQQQLPFAPWILHYAGLARQAVLSEVNLTPKPGLVDRNNSGAHKDMGLEEFYRSTEAIAKWFPHFIQFGFTTSQQSSTSILCDIRPLGLACEQEMFNATNGINTHKGSIFSMGLLLAAIGRLTAQQVKLTPETICHEVALFCRGMVARELKQTNSLTTAGQRLYQQFGLTGARGEAESGFNTVLTISLPAYQAELDQHNDAETALHQALLSLMAINDDTNIASRGGITGLHWFKSSAATLLKNGGSTQPYYLNKLKQFDQDCIEKNLSPGGSADLLIITQFLAQFETQPNYEY